MQTGICIQTYTLYKLSWMRFCVVFLRDTAQNLMPSRRGTMVDLSNLCPLPVLGCSGSWEGPSVTLTALVACLWYSSVVGLPSVLQHALEFPQHWVLHPYLQHIPPVPSPNPSMLLTSGLQRGPQMVGLWLFSTMSAPGETFPQLETVFLGPLYATLDLSHNIQGAGAGMRISPFVYLFQFQLCVSRTIG